MSAKLFVGGLPFSYTDDELRTLLAGVGKVVSAVMVHDPDRGRSRGFGFVEMGTPEEARAAIAQLNGQKIGEKNIYVTEARERKPTPPKPDGAPRFENKLNRKVGRPPRENRFSGPGNPAATDPTRSPDRPAWPPRRGEPYKGKRPFDRGGPGPNRATRGPGGFSAPGSGSGFSRPNKWEPRGDDKRSFSPPRDAKGDFGPTDRRPGKPFRKPFGKSRPSAPGQPPKKEFWRKFEKKKP